MPLSCCGQPARKGRPRWGHLICSSWDYCAQRSQHQLPFERMRRPWLLWPVRGRIEHAILALSIPLFPRLWRQGHCSASMHFALAPGHGAAHLQRRDRQYVTPGRLWDDPAILRDPIDGERLDLLQKMSSPKVHGVAAVRVIDRYGADTARLFICSGPSRKKIWSGRRRCGKAVRFLQSTVAAGGIAVTADAPARPRSRRNGQHPAEKECGPSRAFAASADVFWPAIQFNTAGRSCELSSMAASRRAAAERGDRA